METTPLDQERALAVLQYARLWDEKYTDYTADETGWRTTNHLSTWGCGKKVGAVLDILLGHGKIAVRSKSYYGNQFTSYRAL